MPVQERVSQVPKPEFLQSSMAPNDCFLLDLEDLRASSSLSSSSSLDIGFSLMGKEGQFCPKLPKP